MININAKYDKGTVECAKGFIKLYDGQVVECLESLLTGDDSVAGRYDEHLVSDQHSLIVECVRDIGRNIGVLTCEGEPVIFSSIVVKASKSATTRKDYRSAIVVARSLAESDHSDAIGISFLKVRFGLSRDRAFQLYFDKVLLPVARYNLGFQLLKNGHTLASDKKAVLVYGKRLSLFNY